MFTMDKKILLVGPWIGEFGWELFCWQGFIRKQSKQFDKTIVIGRPGNGFLYEDFCDEYIEFDPESFDTDAWRCHKSKPYKDLVSSIPHSHYLDGQFDIGMRYTQKGVIDTKGLFFSQQEYVKYLGSSDKKYDIIFHCRNKKVGGERNWDKDKWIVLYNLLKDKYTIACIGNNEAFHIEGTEDLRNITLKELAGILNNSNMIIGPSSGPMHFASLCGTKHLVWSTDYNLVRYKKDWNPLKTEVIFYGNEGWNPKPENIKNIIEETIK